MYTHSYSDTGKHPSSLDMLVQAAVANCGYGGMGSGTFFLKLLTTIDEDTDEMTPKTENQKNIDF